MNRKKPKNYLQIDISSFGELFVAQFLYITKHIIWHSDKIKQKKERNPYNVELCVH